MCYTNSHLTQNCAQVHYTLGEYNKLNIND